MRILFIENRYRTLFWREMAKALIDDGHQVRFIVQNHYFKRSPEEGGNLDFIIPYPKSLTGKNQNPKNEPLILSDRNVNYFMHPDTAHYDYYREYLGKILEEFKPEVVFGESTAFHELITIDICKERAIPYLHPSTTRYPSGRFSFYKYDTLTPFGGSGELMPETEAKDIIGAIVDRTTKPDYMRMKKPTLSSKVKRLKELAEHSMAFYRGEHYNTPSPFVKRKIEKRKEGIIKRWDELAAGRMAQLDNESFKILYPMHMQPEANLDVWGRPYRNQLLTIRGILENIPSDTFLIVKPNPKSKYELTDELLDFIMRNPRIIPVVHPTPMERVLKVTDLVVTVTGTIAIECILSNKPVVTLVNTLNNTNENCIFIDSLSKVGSYVYMVKQGKFPKIDESKKIEFFNLLNRTGFKGLPYESYLSDAQNVENCIKAFRHVINNL